VVPFSRCSTLGGRSFFSTAARFWNSLPPDISGIDTSICFKRRLRAYLLDQF
jgi:hypothetical protein